MWRVRRPRRAAERAACTGMRRARAAAAIERRQRVDPMASSEMPSGRSTCCLLGVRESVLSHYPVGVTSRPRLIFMSAATTHVLAQTVLLSPLPLSVSRPRQERYDRTTHSTCPKLAKVLHMLCARRPPTHIAPHHMCPAAHPSRAPATALRTIWRAARARASAPTPTLTGSQGWSWTRSCSQRRRRASRHSRRRSARCPQMGRQRSCSPTW
jgi:hypothetical protein